MHYTSIENIHKVIDPLFLDELREDLDEALAYKRDYERKNALVDFQKKLASLKFFDPACGSGNFLTETYLSLRRLENEAIRAFGKDQISLDPSWLIKVNINQFYGIEINDFAVKVATTALWIAESQTVKETEEIV
jgi:type II restriction/modification system DNA methylase subunit YeeA